jgi:SSS family solute:Na+ symporter
MPPGWVYAALAIYVVIGTAVALASKRGMGKGLTEYFLANRTIGGFVGALTYSATTYSAFMLVGLAGFTYRGGVGALGFELIYLSGLVLVAFFGPRFWLAGRKYNYVTPTELLADRYQSRLLGYISALACMVFLIPYSAVQLMGIGYLLKGLSGGSIPFMTGVIIATLLAISWALIAGMRSVAWTDSLQALFMIVAAVLSVVIIAYRGFGGFGPMFFRLEAEYAAWLTVPGPGFFNIKAFIGLTIPWFFFSISNPQVSQRLFVTKSLKSMRTMLLGFLAFGFIYTLVSVIWGFSALLLLPSLANADLATPTLLGLTSVLPPLLSIVAMIGITAAAISTVDSIILTLSSMVSRDLYGVSARGVDEARQLLAGKLFIPVFALLILLFARLELGLIAALSVASSAGLLVLVPAIFGAFFWKGSTAQGAVASIILGGGIALYLQFSGLRPLGHWPGVWSIITSAITFLAVSLATRPPVEKAEEFLGYLAKSLKEHGAL